MSLRPAGDLDHPRIGCSGFSLSYTYFIVLGLELGLCSRARARAEDALGLEVGLNLR